MPVTKGATRKLAADKRKTAVNQVVKLAFKEAVAKMRRRPSTKNLAAAYRQLDRAAKTHLIHKNKAARLKSRISKLLQKRSE